MRLAHSKSPCLLSTTHYTLHATDCPHIHNISQSPVGVLVSLTFLLRTQIIAKQRLSARLLVLIRHALGWHSDVARFNDENTTWESFLWGVI